MKDFIAHFLVYDISLNTTARYIHLCTEYMAIPQTLSLNNYNLLQGQYNVRYTVLAYPKRESVSIAIYKQIFSRK